jgi:hypothetical protein
VKAGELTDDMMMISAYEIYTEDMKVMDKAFIEGYDGKLCLSIVKAEMNPDFAHYGKLNPYTKLQVGNQEFMTTVKLDGGVNPVWNETWIIPVKNGVTQRVSVIGVWNSEKANKKADLIIGEKTLELPTLIEHRSGFLPLSYAKDRKSAGRLVWKSVWKPTPPPVARMKFDVLMWSGNRVPLEMEVTSTIEDVKEKLQNTEFVDASYIRLQYQDKDLENDETLAVVKASAGAGEEKITLVAKEALAVTVVSFGGNEITLSMLSSDTVMDVKQRLQDKEGVDKYQIRLRKDGVELLDNLSLEEVKGQARSNTIKLVAKEKILARVRTPKGD